MTSQSRSKKVVMATTRWLKNLAIAQGESGLGLVEAVIAVAVTGVSVIAFVTSLSTGSIAVQEQEEQVVVQRLASSQLEVVKAQGYIQTADYDPGNPATSYPAIDTPPGYSVSVSVASIPEADTDIQEVTVTVSHESENILTIADYKVNR